ncbi:MAG: DEAD/DEAH box helicase, partial [Tissierellia bacterium]|nr:DEAD/DEAH box helicase [Tissierellia bacterium]
MRVSENPRKDENVLRIDRNGIVRELKEGEEDTGFTELDIIRYQMEIAIESHLDQQFKLLDAGKKIKALSLFFIDEVAKVRGEDGGDGEYFKLFDEVYKKVINRTEYKNKFEEYDEYFKSYKDTKSVRQGYFAVDRNQKVAKIDESRLEKENWRKAEREAIANGIELILEKKEELLSFDTPLAFIFSHSALREGWDNPNIFTLCTLKKTDNEIAKKQEIGRGLRLPVDIYGKRHKDIDYNVLTVVANSSYDEFSKSLQKSFNEDTGFDKEEIDTNVIYKIFNEAGLVRETIDSQLVTEFIKELKVQGIIDKNNKLKKDIGEELKNLEFTNEILKAHTIKLKEKIVEIMEEKGSKRIIIENGDEAGVKNTWNSFVNEEGFKDIIFNLKNRLELKTYYKVQIDDEEFIMEAIKQINEEFKHRELDEQYLTIEEALEERDRIQGFSMDRLRPEERLIEAEEMRIERSKFEVIDYIMEGTDLPRKALGAVYEGVEKKHLFNSQENLDLALKAVDTALTTHISKRPIEYDLIKGYRLDGDTIFEMDTIINTEIGEVKRYMYPLNPVEDSTKKGMNKYYKFDSKGELEFAQDLDKDP